MKKKIIRAAIIGTGFLAMTGVLSAPLGTASTTFAKDTGAINVMTDEAANRTMDLLALTSGVTTVLSSYLADNDLEAINEYEQNSVEVYSSIPESSGATDTSDVIDETVVEDDAEKTDVDFEKGQLAAANVEENVNIRAKAGEDSEIVGRLYKGGVVTILKEKDGWFKIKSGNCKGFIKAEYLSLDEEAVEAVSRRVAIVHADKLRIRRAGDEAAEIKCMVPDGEELTVLSEKDPDWVEVDLEEGSGFVSREFVELDTIYKYAETIEEEEARLKKEAEEAEAARRAAEEARKKAQAQETSSSGSSSSTGSSSGKKYSAPAGTDGSSVAAYASQFVGNPYVYGGTSLTNGADCSGFVMSVYNAFGVSLPHSSSSLRSSGYGVSLSDIQPGDIVCYSGHVAIYVGNNTIVHASTKKTGIKFSSPVDYRNVLAVRRIF